MLIQSYDSPQLDNLLKKFWDLESLGISADEPSAYDKVLFNCMAIDVL